MFKELTVIQIVVDRFSCQLTSGFSRLIAPVLNENPPCFNADDLKSPCCVDNTLLSTKPNINAVYFCSSVGLSHCERFLDIQKHIRIIVGLNKKITSRIHEIKVGKINLEKKNIN